MCSVRRRNGLTLCRYVDETGTGGLLVAGGWESEVSLWDWKRGGKPLAWISAGTERLQSVKFERLMGRGCVYHWYVSVHVCLRSRLLVWPSLPGGDRVGSWQTARPNPLVSS